MVDAVRRPAWRVDVLSEPARAALVAAGALPVKPGERTLLLTLAPAESGGDQAAALLQALHDLGLCDPALGCLTPRLRDLGLHDPWLGHSALGDPGLRDSGPPAGPARPGLSAREVEIMRHLVAGLSNSEIGRALYISRKTVKNHLSNIYAKLDAHTRSAAVATWLGTRPPAPVAA
jgi:DNA-binding CsgD family transcriptional regulator